jgi:hypothetical protein
MNKNNGWTTSPTYNKGKSLIPEMSTWSGFLSRGSTRDGDDLMTRDVTTESQATTILDNESRPVSPTTLVVNNSGVVQDIMITCSTTTADSTLVVNEAGVVKEFIPSPIAAARAFSFLEEEAAHARQDFTIKVQKCAVKPKAGLQMFKFFRGDLQNEHVLKCAHREGIPDPRALIQGNNPKMLNYFVLDVHQIHERPVRLFGSWKKIDPSNQLDDAFLQSIRKQPVGGSAERGGCAFGPHLTAPTNPPWQYGKRYAEKFFGNYELEVHNAIALPVAVPTKKQIEHQPWGHHQSTQKQRQAIEQAIHDYGKRTFYNLEQTGLFGEWWRSPSSFGYGRSSSGLATTGDGGTGSTGGKSSDNLGSDSNKVSSSWKTARQDSWNANNAHAVRTSWGDSHNWSRQSSREVTADRDASNKQSAIPQQNAFLQRSYSNASQGSQGEDHPDRICRRGEKLIFIVDRLYGGRLLPPSVGSTLRDRFGNWSEELRI